MRNMFNKKVVFIFIIVVIVLTTALVVFSSRSRPEPIVVNPEATFSPPTSNQVIIPNMETQNQTVDNFYTDATFTYPNGSSVIEENQYYQIVFLAPEKKFTINIYYPGDEQNRKLAENAFLARLNINQEQACKLNTTVQIYTEPNLVSVPTTTQLSFCQ